MYMLPKLAYRYDALEPYFDARTMEIHHTKHHQAYIDKLNEALKPYTELASQTVEQLLQMVDDLPSEVRLAVRNHGGGHVNHTLFWQLLSPQSSDSMPEELRDLFRVFGSFIDFKNSFYETALSRFGSGWTWLVVDKNGDLQITSTANQDSPIMDGLTPILALDVWEHAYYLKYQNRRADYVSAFWKVVNWQKVVELYQNTVNVK